MVSGAGWTAPMRVVRSCRVCVACSVSEMAVTSSGVSASNAILLSVGITASKASFSADEKSLAVTVRRICARRPLLFGTMRAACSDCPSEDSSCTCNPEPCKSESPPAAIASKSRLVVTLLTPGTPRTNTMS
jgi:hypothetical protein